MTDTPENGQQSQPAPKPEPQKRKESDTLGLGDTAEAKVIRNGQEVNE